jgi:hypothetical protein
MDAWMDGWMRGWVDGWMEGRKEWLAWGCTLASFVSSPGLPIHDFGGMFLEKCHALHEEWLWRNAMGSMLNFWVEVLNDSRSGSSHENSSWSPWCFSKAILHGAHCIFPRNPLTPENKNDPGGGTLNMRIFSFSLDRCMDLCMALYGSIWISDISLSLSLDLSLSISLRLGLTLSLSLRVSLSLSLDLRLSLSLSLELRLSLDLRSNGAHTESMMSLEPCLSSHGTYPHPQHKRLDDDSLTF